MIFNSSVIIHSFLIFYFFLLSLQFQFLVWRPQMTWCELCLQENCSLAVYMQEVWVKFWTLGPHMHSDIDLGRFSHYLLKKSLPWEKVKRLDLNSWLIKKRLQGDLFNTSWIWGHFPNSDCNKETGFAGRLMDWISGLSFCCVTIPTSDTGPSIKAVQESNVYSLVQGIFGWNAACPTLVRRNS